jgi:hypothetical protein
MDQQTRRESALTQRFDSLLAKVNKVNDGMMDRWGTGMATARCITTPNPL